MAAKPRFSVEMANAIFTARRPDILAMWLCPQMANCQREGPMGHKSRKSPQPNGKIFRSWGMHEHNSGRDYTFRGVNRFANANDAMALEGEI